MPSWVQMKFTLIQNTPISRVWKPKLVFTGTSIMGINPENGVCACWDTFMMAVHVTRQDPLDALGLPGIFSNEHV